MFAILQPHSCCYCKRLSIIYDGSYCFTKPETLASQEVREGAKRGCTLLEYLLRQFKTHHGSTCQPFRLSSRSSYEGRDLYELEFKWECWPGCSANSNPESVDDLHIVALKNAVGPQPWMRAADQLLNLHPASDNSFKWMRQQLQNCQENHEMCRKVYDSQRHLKIPCRLIDVGQPGASILYLRETELPGMDTYAISSYTWGSEKSTAIADSKLNSQNLRSRMKEGMLFSEMPRTIQDVVTVTRELGLSYLWIDALCIVQDDEDERERELNDMPNFYQRSDVVILATRAEHGDEGFLYPRDVAQAYGAVYELSYQQTIPDGITNATVILCENEPRNENANEPLNQRIWTHQEQKATLRMLSFGSRQTIWSCQQDRSVDGGSSSQENPEPKFTQPHHDGSERAVASGFELEDAVWKWMHEVGEYSHRVGDPSRKLDRLHAFAETTRLLSEHVGWPITQCCWGIWESKVIQLLLWVKETPQIEDRYGPSWSWLSLPGPVRYPTSAEFCRSGDPRDYNLDIIRFPKEEEPDLRLQVRGSLLKILWDGNTATARDARNGELLSVNITWDYNVTVRSMWLLEVISEQHGSTSCGLVLKNKRDAEFERCGHFELAYMDLSQYKGKTDRQLWNKSREHLWTDKAEVFII